MSHPSPALMPKFKQPDIQVVADVTEAQEAKVIRKGEHDGVVKAKHLLPGQEIRPHVRDRQTGNVAPRGSLRVVESVTKNDDGSEVYVEFSTPHVAQWYKAAYRFYDESLAGTPLTEVKQSRPAPDDHLTYRPFEALAEVEL